MELGLLSFDSLVAILWGRRWTTLIAAAACLAITAAVSLVMTPKYTATATLLIDFQEPVSNGTQPLAATLQPNYLTTQIGIIASRHVAEKVVDELNLPASPLWQEAFKAATDGTGVIRDWIIGMLIDPNALQVVPGTGSRLVNVGFTTTNPQMAAQVANGFARAYEETNLELSTDPARREAEHHEQALAELREKVERAQQRLSAFQSEKGIVLTDERLDVETERLKDLVSQRIKSEGDLQALEAKAGRIEELRASGETLDTLPDVLTNDVVRDLKGRLAAKEAEFADVARQLGRNHPQYKSVAAEVAALRAGLNRETAAIAVGVRNELAQSRERIRTLLAAEREQKERVLAMKKERDSLPALQRDLESAQTNYDQGLVRNNQYLAQSLLSQTNVTLLNPALPSQKPSSPNLPLNLGLALVLGLMLGVAISLLRELLDRRVRTGQELEGLSQAPVLGTLPADRP